MLTPTNTLSIAARQDGKGELFTGRFTTAGGSLLDPPSTATRDQYNHIPSGAGGGRIEIPHHDF